MAKPKGLVQTSWSPQFAYAVGLLVSDGCLSSDGRHISFTTKDEELARHFLQALRIPNHHVGKKNRKRGGPKEYCFIQIGDVLFYRFLVRIGLMPNKSKILKSILIPDQYFIHFVRGLFDGDGTSYSYVDRRWKSSTMFYLAFTSASPIFIRWLQIKIADKYQILGHISLANRDNVEQLRYAKNATRQLYRVMYANHGGFYLKRKYLKILEALSILSTP